MIAKADAAMGRMFFDGGFFHPWDLAGDVGDFIAEAAEFVQIGTKNLYRNL